MLVQSSFYPFIHVMVIGVLFFSFELLRYFPVSVVLKYYRMFLWEEFPLRMLSMYRSVLLTVLQKLGSFSNHLKTCISFMYIPRLFPSS